MGLNNLNRTVISIGRGGEKREYQISEENATFVNTFLEKTAKKNFSRYGKFFHKN